MQKEALGAYFVSRSEFHVELLGGIFGKLARQI
jgi:hypothetical protein